MSHDPSVTLHTEAAAKLEHTSKHLREAAQNIENGQHEHASQHAFISHGHVLTAQGNTRQCARLEAGQHSHDVLQTIYLN